MMNFEKRALGRTSLEVTAFGLGCATMGGHRIPVTRAEAEAIVRAAWAAGVRYVDTAPYYGFGQAERCVGDALRAVPRDEWVLSTKVGRLLGPHAKEPAGETPQSPMPFDAVFDYSYDAIMRSLEDSLRSCPRAWCKSGVAFALSGGFGRCCQAAAAGSLKIGSSLNGAIVSSVM